MLQVMSQMLTFLLIMYDLILEQKPGTCRIMAPDSVLRESALSLAVTMHTQVNAWDTLDTHLIFHPFRLSIIVHLMNTTDANISKGPYSPNIHDLLEIVINLSRLKLPLPNS